MAALPPTEFSQEAVRQLMLANGGRITNHDLVKSFRRWLTDPSCREEARVQFKDFVNNLATIRQEDGEKYLVLKKKYFPEYYTNDTKAQILSPQYQQEFYTNNPEKMYERSGYMPSPSSGYSSSSGGHQQSPGYITSPPSYTNGPSSLNTPSSLISPPSSSYHTNSGSGGRSSSPSLLDEVMAGFNPPSRTLGRQPASLPPAPPTQTYNNRNLFFNQTGYQAPPSSRGGGYQQPSYPSSGQYNTGTSQRNSVSGGGSGYSNGTNSIQNNHSSTTNYNNFAQQQQQPPSQQSSSRYNGYPSGQPQPPSIHPQYNNNSIRSDSRQDLRYEATNRSSVKDLRYNNSPANNPPNNINHDPRLQRMDSRQSINKTPPYLPERQNSRPDLTMGGVGLGGRPSYDRHNSVSSPPVAADSDYNPNMFSPHYSANSRYSITSTTSHSSGGSQLPSQAGSLSPGLGPGSSYPGGPQTTPPYPAPPGSQQPYPAGPSGPGRSASSPHTPYQPVYPDASKRSQLYTRTMSNSGLPNTLQGYSGSPGTLQGYTGSPQGYSSSPQSTLPAASSYATSPPARISPPQPSIPSSRYMDGGLGLPPALPPSRSSVTSLEQSAGERRGSLASSTGKIEPPPYRPPPPELGLPPRALPPIPSSGVSRQNSALPPRPGSRPSAAPPPVPSLDPRRNSTTSLHSLASSMHGLPPPPERPTRLDVDPPDLGLPPVAARDTKPPAARPLHHSSGSRPDETMLSNQKSAGSLSKSYGNLTATSSVNNLDENKENYRLEASQSVDNLSEEVISVRERTKTFNRMASDVSLTGSTNKLASIVKRRNSRAIEMGMMSRRGSNYSTRGGGEEDSLPDTSSITTLDPTIKSFMIMAAKGDYQTVAKMLSENPKLVRHTDLTSGYTALHWAAKHGNNDLVKLIAGTFKAQVNVKSHGGYTALHLAAQHGHQDVFDLLVGAYHADANIRDNSGKRARQYVTQADANSSTFSLSSDTFRQLKDRRRTRTNRLEKNQSGGMLRFGSISVKVKKTTEAFNNYFNSSSNSSSSHNSSSHNNPRWQDKDSQKMPPPKFAPIKKRKSKRTIDFGLSRSAPTTPVGKPPAAAAIPEVNEERGSDSDSEFGFGNSWSNA